MAKAEAARRGDDITACACFNARNAARAITDLYDSVLEPSGLRVTQFAILVAIYNGRDGEPATMQEVAAGLDLDPSTMTRTLRPLVDGGAVEVRPGSDRRAKILILTKQGRRKLAEGHHLWREAQRELRASVGGEIFDRLIGDLQTVSRSLRR